MWPRVVSGLGRARVAFRGARVAFGGARVALGGARVALIGLALVAAGCVRVEGYRCATDGDCNSGTAGRCEPDGFCSFAGVGSCGRGYGEGAGSLSGTCLVDAGPDGDRDDDGVADERDNCVEVANADQADEDGDVRGDVCDNCPATANTDQANGDGDGLGDRCDPRVGGENRIVLFDPLNEASAAGWSLVGGKVEFKDDGLYFQGGITVIDRPYEAATDEEVVFTAGFAITAVDATQQLALALAAPIDNLDLVACGVFDDANAASAFAAVVELGTSMATTQIGTFPGALTANTNGSFTYAPAGAADGADCGVNLRTIGVQASVAVERSPNGRVGFVQTNMTVVVPYLFAFTR